MFSKRIKKIASLVEKGVYVIDIGCDHALLDIYLTLYNDNVCLASDINEKSIQIAKKNIERYQLNIKTNVSNGFEKMKVPKYSTCIIAGMGTNNIIDIIKKQKEKSVTYIIQTNNDYYLLRKYMVKNGFYIENEITFVDKKIRYIIIKFKNGNQKYTDFELMYGPVLIKNKKQNIDYFLEIYQKNDQILKDIPIKYMKKRCQLKKINQKIKKLIDSF